MDANMKKPALISGAVTGLLTGLSTIIPLLSCCCCVLLPLGGGVLSAKLFSSEAGGRGLTPGEGATVGAIAGGVGAAVYLIIAIPLTLAGAALSFAFAQNASDAVPGAALSFVSGFVGKLVGALVLVGLSAAGGALGSAIFKGPMGPGGPTYPGAPPSYPGGSPYGGTPGGGTPYGQGGPYGGGQGGPYGGGQGGGQPY